MGIGDYVRTKLGTIGKLIEQNNDYAIISYKNDELFIKKEEIKSSPNIIDLIQVGDYVNGHQVIYTAGEKHKLVYVEYVNMDKLLEVKSYQIKSIVTKEQFESMEYKVGE